MVSIPLVSNLIQSLKLHYEQKKKAMAKVARLFSQTHGVQKRMGGLSGMFQSICTVTIHQETNQKNGTSTYRTTSHYLGCLRKYLISSSTAIFCALQTLRLHWNLERWLSTSSSMLCFLPCYLLKLSDIFGCL